MASDCLSIQQQSRIMGRLGSMVRMLILTVAGIGSARAKHAVMAPHKLTCTAGEPAHVQDLRLTCGGLSACSDALVMLLLLLLGILLVSLTCTGSMSRHQQQQARRVFLQK